MTAVPEATANEGPREATQETTARRVHPVSAKLLAKVPCLNYIPILGVALRAFHPKFIFAIFTQRLFEKGLANGLMRLSIQPMMTVRYGISGALYQRYSSLYSLGWSINAFFTVFADTFALFGYTKRWYSFGSAILGGVFAVLYGLLPARESSAQPAAAFLFLTALCMGNVDVFSIALYSRQIRHEPEAGPALVSWMWATALGGLMISSIIQGPLSDNNLTQVGVYITAGIMFTVSLLFVFNFFEERRNMETRHTDAKIDFLNAKAAQERKEKEREAHKASKVVEGEPVETPSQEDCCAEEANGTVQPCPEPIEEADVENMEGYEAPDVRRYLGGAVEMNLDVIKKVWKIAVFCGIMTAAVVAAAVVTIIGTRWEVLYTVVVALVVVCGSSFFTLPLVVAKTVVFMYLNAILYLNLPGVLNTFYLSPPECFPDGPHFTYTFYNIMNGVVGNIASMIGTILFTHLLSKQSYRFVMGLSAILLPVGSMFDFIIVNRWNLYIGIPDHAMYIFGDAVIYECCEMLLNMPTMMLMCRVCPRGSESMVFALLAGIYHLGTSTSSAIGYILMETIWPITTTGVCDFSNARWLVLTGHIVAPIFILPLSYLLLPAARICDNIDEKGNEVPPEIREEPDLSSTGVAEETEAGEERHPHSPEQSDRQRTSTSSLSPS